MVKGKVAHLCASSRARVDQADSGSGAECDRRPVRGQGDDRLGAEEVPRAHSARRPLSGRHAAETRMLASRKTRSLTLGSELRVGCRRDPAPTSARLAGPRHSRRHWSRSPEGIARAVLACSARQAATMNEMVAAMFAWESSGWRSSAWSYLVSVAARVGKSNETAIARYARMAP